MGFMIASIIKFALLLTFFPHLQFLYLQTNRKYQSFLIKNWPLGLRSFTNRAFCILFKPFNDTLLMVDMLTFEFYDQLQLFKLAVAYCT